MGALPNYCPESNTACNLCNSTEINVGFAFEGAYVSYTWNDVANCYMDVVIIDIPDCAHVSFTSCVVNITEGLPYWISPNDTCAGNLTNPHTIYINRLDSCNGTGGFAILFNSSIYYTNGTLINAGNRQGDGDCNVYENIVVPYNCSEFIPPPPPPPPANITTDLCGTCLEGSTISYDLSLLSTILEYTLNYADNATCIIHNITLPLPKCLSIVAYDHCLLSVTASNLNTCTLNGVDTSLYNIYTLRLNTSCDSFTIIFDTSITSVVKKSVSMRTNTSICTNTSCQLYVPDTCEPSTATTSSPPPTTTSETTSDTTSGSDTTTGEQPSTTSSPGESTTSSPPPQTITNTEQQPSTSSSPGDSTTGDDDNPPPDDSTGVNAPPPLFPTEGNTIDNGWIDFDCNSNNIEDASDIFNRRSKDINGDGIPDECQKLGWGNWDLFLALTGISILLLTYCVTLYYCIVRGNFCGFIAKEHQRRKKRSPRGSPATKNK